METDIQSLLVQYSEEIDELTSSLNDPLLPPNTTQLHLVQRHRELLVELSVSSSGPKRTCAKHLIGSNYWDM